MAELTDFQIVFALKRGGIFFENSYKRIGCNTAFTTLELLFLEAARASSQWGMENGRGLRPENGSWTAFHVSAFARMESYKEQPL